MDEATFQPEQQFGEMNNPLRCSINQGYMNRYHKIGYKRIEKGRVPFAMREVTV